MNEQVEQKSDFGLREYQRNIIDVCVERNSIVYLPTGAGKTYIAIQVIKHYSDKLHGTYSDGAKRSFFLVNTVALAQQQAEHIRLLLPFKVCVLTGENNVDNFDSGDWLEYLNENEVFVMTAQCFADAIDRTFIRLESVNVIIFDECHHGRKDHVYHQIMQKFESCETADEIKVVGLSGMLVGNDNKTTPSTVSEELLKLEATFQSTIITVNTIDDHKNVLIYSTKANEYLYKFSGPRGMSEIQMQVTVILQKITENLLDVKLEKVSSLNPKTLRESIPAKIHELIKMINDLIYQIGTMGNYGTYLGLLSVLIQLELAKRVADSKKFSDAVKSCITIVEFCIGKMKQGLNINNKNPQFILENSAEKVQKLLLILKQFYNRPDREQDMQCLIFTQRRSTAKILYHLIRNFGEEQDNFPIKPDFVVGRNNTMAESIESIISQSNNNLALEKFNQNETNCIVCTNVLEEGIDLQACNLVIVYDPPQTLRSYVQSRGRARDDKSTYIVFLEEQDVPKFQKKHFNWKNVDKEMKRILVGKTIDRQPPDEEHIRNELQQLWDPFFTKEKACLTALNAIPILHQYAQSLPADRFTNVNIQWNRIDGNGVQVCLRLPTQSMLNHEICGEFRQNVKIAKQDAAFKACLELYYNGYLTEQLTPVDNEIKIEELNSTYFEHWENYNTDDRRKAGTKNNRRFHKIKVPRALQNCGPKIGTNFLYRIIIKPKFQSQNSNALKVFNMLFENENTFSVLTTKRIPKLCKMSLFQSFGEIECEISDLPTMIEIDSQTDLQKLQKFHVNIFRDILKIFQNFFVLDKTSYLVVPVNEYNEINWNLIDNFKEIPQPQQMTKSQIESMTFKPDDYIYKVINPVYRDNTEQNYVVINIVENKTPLSTFPNMSMNKSYQEYFKEKYQLDIYRKDQFLIKVKGISKNLKLFFPGCGLSGKQKKYEMKEFDCEEYIPEICHNYKFPGDYWLKATLLPSIFHRMFYMLLAEELRCWLINEKIDGNFGEQVYKLDIDYGDYEKREEIVNQYGYDTVERLENFQEVMRQLNDVESERKPKKEIRTEANLLWGEYLPKDIDRDWENVTEVDIEYYSSFLSGNTGNKNAKDLEKTSVAGGSHRAAKKLPIKQHEDYKNINLLNVKNFSRSIQQKDLLKVLTTANAGDVFDMERYETIGDAFLKFITSLFLYKMHENFHEGYLTALKGKIVSNRNLYYIGNDFGLSKMLKTTQYNHECCLAPSTMLPTNIKEKIVNNKSLLRALLDVNDPLSWDEINNGVMKSNLELFDVASNTIMYSNEENENDNIDVDKTIIGYINEQYIGDKIIADSVEALLGCVVTSIGPAGGLKLCRKLKILPQNNTHENLLTDSIEPRICYDTDTCVTNQLKLEKTLNYKFRNNVYLTQALTHASYPNKSAGTYQQLEFLGDAVLDFLITSFIFEKCPQMSPGKLTDLRSALVNNITLACIIVRNEIHKHMLYENHILAESIKSFVEFQKSNGHQVTDQVILLNTEDDMSVAQAVEVPKALGDIFESIVGAVYLDTNLSLTKTWDVIYGLMCNEIHKFMADVPLQIIRRLYEFQGGKLKPKFFKTEMVDGDDNVAVPLRIRNLNGKEEFIIGFGKNRKLAKEAAAKKALNLK